MPNEVGLEGDLKQLTKLRDDFLVANLGQDAALSFNGDVVKDPTDGSHPDSAIESLQILGAGALVLKAVHDNSAGTLQVAVLFFDVDDNYIGARIVDLDAQSLFPLEGGDFESESALLVNIGGSRIRIVALAASGSTGIDIFAGFLDGFTLT